MLIVVFSFFAHSNSNRLFNGGVFNRRRPWARVSGIPNDVREFGAARSARNGDEHLFDGLGFGNWHRHFGRRPFGRSVFVFDDVLVLRSFASRFCGIFCQENRAALFEKSVGIIPRKKMIFVKIDK